MKKYNISKYIIGTRWSFADRLPEPDGNTDEEQRDGP
jgi:hypothetical protein